MDCGRRGDDDVEPAKAFAGIAHQLTAYLGLAEIRLQREGPAPERLDIGHHRPCHVRSAVVVNCDVRALAGEPQCDRPADAVAAGPGDQGFLAVEPHHSSPS